MLEKIKVLLELHNWDYKNGSDDVLKQGHRQREDLIKNLRSIPAYQALTLLRKYVPTKEHLEDILMEMGVIPPR